MGVLEDLEKITGVVASVVWAAFIVFNMLGLKGSVLGLQVELPSVSLQVEQIGQYLLNLLYTIFMYVLAAVTIIAGIQAALGFVNKFISTFVPISIPGSNLNTLIRTVIGLYIIKLIVDAALRYWGFPRAGVALLDAVTVDYTSWTFVTSVAVGVVVGALLVRYITRRGGVEVFRL